MPGIADYELTPNEQKLRAAMAAFAKFHLAVADFPTDANRPAAGAPLAIVRHLARLQELANGRIEELSQAINKSQWPEFERMAHAFLTTLPRLLPRAIERLVPLASVSLPAQPCFRDIWHDHVLFTGNEVTGIIDYGTWTSICPQPISHASLAAWLAMMRPAGASAWTPTQKFDHSRPKRKVPSKHSVQAAPSSPAATGFSGFVSTADDSKITRQILNRFRQIVTRCTVAAMR